jgi:hypothetical protein
MVFIRFEILETNYISHPLSYKEYILDVSEEFLCGVIMGMQCLFQRSKYSFMNISIQNKNDIYIKIDLDSQYERLNPYYLDQDNSYSSNILEGLKLALNGTQPNPDPKFLLVINSMNKITKTHVIAIIVNNYTTIYQYDHDEYQKGVQQVLDWFNFLFPDVKILTLK